MQGGDVLAGRFEIERLAGSGGMGTVYRAIDRVNGGPVAVKLVTGEAQDDRFGQEARILSELTHPSIVRYVAHGMTPKGEPFLAMEWLEGESLDAIITRRRAQKQSPLGLHKVVKMMRPVAAALAKAHRFPGPGGAVAIIHRDLKPENLMVASIGGSESMKILDFGIAKAKRAASQAAGRVTGRALAEDEMASFTPAYGAPEQWAPKSWGETGPWTDVWGLSLTMVEALCGAPPIDGEPWGMRRACLDEKRRPTPRNHGAEVPLDVEKTFEQALAVDPRQRFNSVEAFWSALEKAMGLPPSLGPRDDRREPSDPRGDNPPLPPRLVAGERVARIELQKMNAQALAVRAAQPAVAPAPMEPASRPEESWELDLMAAPVTPPPSSRSLEMHLPTRSEPPPPASSSRGASLEMSLPVAPPVLVAAPAPPPPPAHAPARSAVFDHGPMALDLGVAEPPRAAPASLASMAPRRRVAEGREVRDRLRAPVGILLVALAVASVEIGFHRFTGGDLAIGPVRPFWIAAPLALFGVGFTLYRLMEDRSDE
jgi:serine/threonine protein kinase